MKQFVILSGKGGTGKTTVAAALAHLSSREMPVVLADADVDAANLELVLDPDKRETHAFIGGKKAVIDPDACIECGRCAEVCRFDAVLSDGEYKIDALACEGCASCFYQCPVDAIRMEEQQSGEWYRSDTRFGPLFHAKLFAGQENSGKLVTLVKQQGRLLAMDTESPLLIIDGPPGMGCPVISASAGADLALLVVEPTVSGLHDLDRVLETTEHFGVPAMVLINKADLNFERAREIAAFCAERDVGMAGHLPYDTRVTEAMIAGKPITDYGDGAVAEGLRKAWAIIKEQIKDQTTEAQS